MQCVAAVTGEALTGLTALQTLVIVTGFHRYNSKMASMRQAIGALHARGVAVSYTPFSDTHKLTQKFEEFSLT